MAAIVLALIYGGWWLILLTFVFGALAAYEYLQLVNKDDNTLTLTGVMRYIDMLLITFPIFALFLFRGAKDHSVLDIVVPTCMLFYFICVVLRVIMTMYDRREGCITALAQSLFGILYITIPLLCMAIVGFERWHLALVMFVLIWLNDTGAFCVGCTIGKHKLCERLSPKKTIEGFLGGMACCVAASVAYALIFDHNPWIFGVYGVLVAVMSTYGDLFESMLKRHAGVKDAGNIIPGHGGVLDRIDSLLFVAPITLLLIFILQ